VKIITECGAPIWKGFFTEPDECPENITFELDDVDTFEDAREAYGFEDPMKETTPGPDDEFTICFSVTCPRCGSVREWPQTWRVVAS
jgi:hypothetical protein